jgi:hypothetical protein
MLSLNRMLGIAIVALVAAVSISVASPATAKPDPRDYPNTNRTQTIGNGAGVIFHPFGDKFEIWDNIKDDQPVTVRWNYVGLDDQWKQVTCRRRYCVIDRNLQEEPRQIYFYIEDSQPARSPLVRYRTWGA